MIYHKPVTQETVPAFNPSVEEWGYMIRGFRTKVQFWDFMTYLRGIHPTVCWRCGDPGLEVPAIAMGWWPTERQGVLSIGGDDSVTSYLHWMPAADHSPLLVLTPEMFLERALFKNLNDD